MFDNQDFENKLKQIAENPDLKEIANLTVNLLSEQATQIQTNVFQAVLLNTLLEIVVESDLTTYEKFQELYQKNLKTADETLTQNFNEAMSKLEEDENSANNEVQSE